MSRLVPIIFPFFLILLSACTAASPPGAGVVASPTTKVVPRPAADAPVVLGDGLTPDLPEVAAERERRRAALQAAPFILLREGLDERSDAAQRAVAHDVRHGTYGFLMVMRSLTLTPRPPFGRLRAPPLPQAGEGGKRTRFLVLLCDL